MLATLAINLSIMLILCTLSFVICWAYDNVGRPVKAEGSGTAESKLAVPPRRRRSPLGLPSPRLARKGWRSRLPRPRLQSRQARPGRRPELSEGPGAREDDRGRGIAGTHSGFGKSARSIVKHGPRSNIDAGRMFGVATRRSRHQYVWELPGIRPGANRTFHRADRIPGSGKKGDGPPGGGGGRPARRGAIDASAIRPAVRGHGRRLHDRGVS